MNILKHMEAVFIATLALAVSTSYLVEAIPDANAKAPASAVATDSAGAPAVVVVTVRAKRMSAEEKARSLRDEQTLAGVRGNSASRM